MDPYSVYRSQLHHHATYSTDPRTPEQRRGRRRAGVSVFVAFVVGFAPFVVDATGFKVALDMGIRPEILVLGSALLAPWLFGALGAWSAHLRPADDRAEHRGFATGFWLGVLALWLAVLPAIGTIIAKGWSGLPG